MPPQPGDVMRVVTHNDVRSRASIEFDRGAEVLNRIVTGCRNSISGNLQGGPGSCGARDERQFFTGDTNFAGEASMLHFDLAPLYSNWLTLAGDTIRESGAIGDYAPDIVGDARAGHANWASGYPWVAWLLWWLHDDATPARRELPRLEAFFEFLEASYNRTGPGLERYWGSCISGWITLGRVPACSAMTAFAYVSDLRMMANLTSALGAPSAPMYEARFAARLAEYHSAFYHPDNASYGHGTMSELAMALWISAPPTTEIRAAVASRLAAAVEGLISATTNATSTDHPKGIDFPGGVGIRYLFEALAGAGYQDTALKLALKKSFPGYGYMFYSQLEPATSLWELWGGDIGDPTMSSRNHIYSASVSTYLFKYLGGITAASPGYDRVLIAPQVPALNSTVATALESVDAALGTPHGIIESWWSTAPILPPPPPSPSPARPTNPTCRSGALEQCAMQEEGTGPYGAMLCVGCSAAGGTIEAVLFASFGSAAAGVDLGNCSSGLKVGTCGGGAPRAKCHPCTRCPACSADGQWPNASRVVAGLCIGRANCSIPVSFPLFGDPCEGKKTLAVKVRCSHPTAENRERTRLTSLLRQTALIPVGVVADVVVTLRGMGAGAVKISESGHTIWMDGAFVPGVDGVLRGAHDKQHNGVRFTVTQGGYEFELSAFNTGLNVLT